MKKLLILALIMFSFTVTVTGDPLALMSYSSTREMDGNGVCHNVQGECF